MNNAAAKIVTPGNVFRAADRHIRTVADHAEAASAWDVTAVILDRMNEITADPFAKSFADQSRALAAHYRDAVREES